MCLEKYSSYPTIKIADFGLSIIFDKNGGKLTTECGSPEYIAPEVITLSEYDEKVDMWSVGVITYILLTGRMPFGRGSENNIVIMFNEIRSGRYNWSKSNASDGAKFFVSTLLEVDANKRHSAKKALNNKWLLSQHAQKNDELSLDEPEICIQEPLEFF